jgi:hypothetical protein
MADLIGPQAMSLSAKATYNAQFHRFHAKSSTFAVFMTLMRWL